MLSIYACAGALLQYFTDRVFKKKSNKMMHWYSLPSSAFLEEANVLNTTSNQSRQAPKSLKNLEPEDKHIFPPVFCYKPDIVVYNATHPRGKAYQPKLH
jgi:hypothetical protein